MTWKNKLVVTYAADDNYAKYLGVSILSLFQNNEEFKAISVFVLDSGVSPKNRVKLEKIAARFGRELIFLPVGGIIDRLPLKMRSRKIAAAAYARLFLGSLLSPDLKHVLYLDCDTLICTPLKDLWNTNLGNNLVGGVQDTVDSFFHRVIGLEPHLAYINSGVLLINLELWREENLEKNFLAFLERFEGTVPHHDQGIINGTIGARKLLLPLKFNVMSNVYAFSVDTIRKIYFLNSYYTQTERETALAQPAIIHFTPGLYGRPWEENCNHPAKEDYLKVLRQSPWGEEPLDTSSLKWSVKLFAFFYNHVPRWLFETIYRAFSWTLHLRK